MTTPDLAYEDDNGNRRYRQPLTGRDDYLSMTGVLSLFPNDIHKIPPARLEVAGRRGDWLHQVLQDRTWDDQLIPPLDIPECREDLESLRWFMAEWQPRIIHQELTVFNDTHGYAGSLDLIAEFGKGIGVAVGDLKGLATHTPIPTPDGWKTMAQLEVGDVVFDKDGRQCKVTAKSGIHENPCYRITFDDSSSIIADEDHRWLVEKTSDDRRGARGGQQYVLTTRELIGNLRGPNGQRHLRIVNAGALKTDEIDLPIDPYVLGAWLGDGTASNGGITKPDDFIFEEIEHRGYSVGPRIGKLRNLDGQDTRTRTVHGLITELRALGVLNNKHIPDIYMRAGQMQRLDLLRGLMDTDGTVNKARSNEQVFTSTDKVISLKVMELVNSLGQRCSMSPCMFSGFGKRVEGYPVRFRSTGINPFLLPRKADLVDISGTSKSWRRLISEVSEVPVVPTQCIEVDSPSHTYLAGEQMVPTHNTSREIRPSYAYQLAGYGAAEYGIIPDGKDGWKRIELPEIESHVIMHIRGDQRRLIPVETAGMEEVVFELAAIAHKLHPWLERGAAAIKHPIAAPNPGHGLLDSRIALIRERIGTMNDDMKTELKERMATSNINLKDPATTHDDLDMMNDHLLAVDRQLGDVPEAWDNRARDDFGARIQDLPPDLKLDVEGPTRQYLDNTGLKGSNMAGQHVRQHHVDFAMNRLTEAEASAAQRYTQIHAAAEQAFFNATQEQLTESLEVIARVASGERTSDPDYLQEFEAQSAVALLEAIGAGLVVMADNDVRVAEHAGEMLVKRWGSKSDVVKAGKDAADARQMTRPRSAADVAADPMIAAATYKAATETAAPAA